MSWVQVPSLAAFFQPFAVQPGGRPDLDTPVGNVLGNRPTSSTGRGGPPTRAGIPTRGSGPASAEVQTRSSEGPLAVLSRSSGPTCRASGYAPKQTVTGRLAGEAERWGTPAA